MITVQLVERIDGTWCAFVEGAEDDVVAAPTVDAALGRLVRQQPERFGIASVGVAALDPAASGEPAARFAAERHTVGPESDAPEVRRPGERPPTGTTP